MGEMGYPRYLRLFRGEQSVEKLVAKYLTGDDNVGSGGDSPGAGAPRQIGHGASSVGAWNPECWRGCAEQDRIPGTFVTRERGAILDGGSLRKHPLEQLPCVAHVALAAAPQGLLSARKPVAEGPKQMQEIESNLHLFQPPRYRASDGSWHATYGNALAQSAPELTLDGAAVLSLLSFNFVCGDRTLLHEIRRRPWLSSIGPAGLPVLSPIPEHGLRWQAYEEIADELGIYVVQLTVNDGAANSQPVTVTISTNDVPPIARPGLNRMVSVGTVVTMDGTASTDSDGQSLTYNWSLLAKPAASSALLGGATSPNPSLQVDVSGDYVVQLIVNDGFLNSSPATLAISSSDVPPIANPGPNQTVAIGTTVTLNGTGSTASNNHALTYKWAILSQPNGSLASLSSKTASKPTFAPQFAGLYVLQLIVNDDWLDSRPATMTVTANPPNQPPVVSAGPNVTIELPVNSLTLNGAASSIAPAGSPVTVQWTQVSGPGTVSFANATQPVTQATFPVAGSYVVRLTGTVTATGLSSSAQATITVAPVNQPPTVTVGSDQTITYPTTAAALTGTATDDGYPVGSTLQINWSKLAGPGTVTFASPTQPNTQATFSLPGAYVLQLSASDGQFTAAGTTRVNFVGPAGGALTVNAGPSQTITFPNSTALNGTVSDPFLPQGGSILVQWNQISGPGAATFSAGNSLTTNVSFSKPGVYDLQLSATDGISSGTNDVLIYVGHLTCTSSNKGTEFWLMFMGQDVADTTTPRFLDLAISGDIATTGDVETS